MLCNLTGKRVLVVEDNFLIAIEIVDALEAANAVVVGPCSNLDDAAMRVAHSDLAVLDVDIRGRNSFALADRLTVLDVPYVFFTGLDRSFLPERFARVDVITKPTEPEVAVRKLDIVARDCGPRSIVDLIPVLRRRARSYLSDPLAADRLVERTLQLALRDPERLPAGSNLLPWLLQRMEMALDAGPMQFLN
jgi:CheY-like chemotaxis protein